MQVQKLQAPPVDKPWGELSTRLSSVQLSMSLPLTATPQVSLAGKQLCGGHPAWSRLPVLSAAAGRWPATPPVGLADLQVRARHHLRCAVVGCPAACLHCC